MSDNAGEVSAVPDEGALSLEADGEKIELVFGLIGPTGVDLGKVYESLKNQLKTVNYEAEMIRLSELITPYLKGSRDAFNNEYDRISTLMENGTRLREVTDQREIVARLGVAQIRAVREKRTSSKRKPSPNTAYIVSSFKRPEEVALFRQIYGKAFILISVYSPRQSRVDELARKLRASTPAGGASAEELAVQLVRRDFAEEDRKLGQRVGKTFPLADYFVSLEPRSALDDHLLRLVRLTFGHPYISPTRDEQSMFFAQAAALRSLDLSRQVGAAIVSSDGDVLSTGCNEVPKFGGGMYWGKTRPNIGTMNLAMTLMSASRRRYWRMLLHECGSRMRRNLRQRRGKLAHLHGSQRQRWRRATKRWLTKRCLARSRS